MTTVCTVNVAIVTPIWIWIVQRLDNRSEWCRTDDGIRFGNAVEQICCQKISFACAYTCVRVRTWVYICMCGCVCGWTYARPWVCAHMSVGAYARILQES